MYSHCKKDNKITFYDPRLDPNEYWIEAGVIIDKQYEKDPLVVSPRLSLHHSPHHWCLTLVKS